MNEAQTKGKILRRTEGVGNEERAGKIARNEGGTEANDPDRTRAKEDQTGSTSAPEQPTTVSEPDPDWYTPRGSSGEKVPKVRPEDDQNIPEKLVREGIGEADHDTRGSNK